MTLCIFAIAIDMTVSLFVAAYHMHGDCEVTICDWKKSVCADYAVLGICFEVMIQYMRNIRLR